RFATQVFCEPRRTRGAKRNVQPRATQVSIDNQRATVRLADDGVRQVRGHERLALRSKSAGDQNCSQLLLASPELIKSRAQRAKLFGTYWTQVSVKKDVRIRIEMPVRVRAMGLQIIEPQELCGKSCGVARRYAVLLCGACPVRQKG